jgi:sterol 3beta-glucosyltransferase
MTIALLAVGTRGDVQPFIALALGLRDAGFSPLIISAKNEEAFVRGFGLPFHALNVDVQKIMDDQEVQEMGKGDNPIAFARSHLQASKTLQTTMVAVQEEIWSAVQNADAIVYHPGMSNAYFMAQELGIPAVLASPFPLASTSEYPAILFYDKLRVGGVLNGVFKNAFNRSTHAVFERIFWMLSRPAAVEFWKRHGKPHLPTRTPPSRLQAASGMPMLFAYSPHLFPQPKEWAAKFSGNLAVTGFWTLPAEENYTPPADLAQFLAAGKPPIYVGFGSIKDKATFQQTLATVVQAVERLGSGDTENGGGESGKGGSKERAVIGLGWSSVEGEIVLPDNIKLIGSVPHTWLFPRMKAVVHHGGAGTTAAGLIAGKPTLIIPHTGDQPAWGRRVWELGVGARPIPKKRLSVDALEAGLRAVLQPATQEKATQIGHLLSQENGVASAVEAIRSFVSTRQLVAKDTVEQDDFVKADVFVRAQ